MLFSFCLFFVLGFGFQAAFTTKNQYQAKTPQDIEFLGYIRLLKLLYSIINANNAKISRLSWRKRWNGMRLRSTAEREDIFLHTKQEDNRKFQTLSRMKSHEGHF